MGLFTAVVTPQCALRVFELYVRMQIAARGIQAQGSVISSYLSLTSSLRIKSARRRISHAHLLRDYLSRTKQWSCIHGPELSELR
jgi:hypothetical protein